MTTTHTQQIIQSVAHSVDRLRLPERSDIATPNVRQSDIDILENAPGAYLDTTHFDTVRYPPPDWAQTVFSNAAADGHLAYTGYRGNENVLETVAKNVSRFLGLPIDPSQNLILTPGTQGALFCVLASQVNPGDRVAILDPDYLFTARILRFLGADVGYVPLRENQGRYAIDMNVLEDEFKNKGAKHLVFSHPNNPTGAVFTADDVTSLAEMAMRYEVRIVVDELYSRLVYAGATFHHLAAVEGMFERTTTLLGPSKTESLSGYRLGVVVADARSLKPVEDVLSITSLRAPAYSQHLLPYWLDKDRDWLRLRLNDLHETRDATVDKLRRLPWLKVHPQNGTAYLWPDVSALRISDAELATEFMQKARVLVSPGYQFGPTANGHFRICYAREEHSWMYALDDMILIMNEIAVSKGLPSADISH